MLTIMDTQDIAPVDMIIIIIIVSCMPGSNDYGLQFAHELFMSC